uniref:Tensilin n=1 Tax=Holothuria forskali TaxID=72674 RepID=A0A1S6EM10_9ECHN|nr:tensilin [Holothuria forskali]
MKTLLLLSLIGALVVSETEACGQCVSDHPQQHYCQSEFVVRVEILDIVSVPAKSMNRVSALIIDSLKLPKRNTGKTVEFYSPAAFCGTHFLKGAEYVVTGNKETDTDGSTYWYHDTCDFAKGWRGLPQDQKKGFTTKYGRLCECQIEGSQSASSHKVAYDNTRNTYPDARTFWTPDNCYYNPLKSGEFSGVDDCESEFGFCTPGSDGECSWELSPEYEDCFKKRDDFVLVDSGAFAITDPAQCSVLPSRRKRRRCRKKIKKYLEEIGAGGGEMEIFF